MAKIIIERPSNFFNMLKPCEIYIDDIKVGTVDNDEEKYFEVAQGEHAIAEKMSMGSADNIFVGESPKVLVTVKGDEVKRLKLSSMSGLLWLLVIIATALGFDFGIQRFVDITHYSFIIYVCVFLLFYFTIFKKKYLTLTVVG